jgi:hypothetical protein
MESKAIAVSVEQPRRAATTDLSLKRRERIASKRAEAMGFYVTHSGDEYQLFTEADCELASGWLEDIEDALETLEEALK